MLCVIIFVGKYHYFVEPLNKIERPTVSVVDRLMNVHRELKWPDIA